MRGLGFIRGALVGAALFSLGFPPAEAIELVGGREPKRANE